MVPTHLTSLVINGFDHAVAPHPVVSTRPTVDAISGLGEIDTVAGMGANDKQAVPGVEAGGTIVGHSGLVGRYQPAVRRRFLQGVRNRTALFIDSKRPVYGAERNRQEVLPVGAVEYKKVAVARTLYQHLSGLAVELSVNQH